MTDKGPRYFDDDGTEFNPDLVPVPDLCVSCTKNEIHDGKEEMLCNVVRLGGQKEKVFLCFAYSPVSPSIDREAVLRALCEEAGVDYDEELSEDNTDEESISF
jgi:hypothetical protein